MTVQYNQDVLTGGPVVFLRLLLRWKGCVLKLIYIDFIVFMLGYGIMSCIYRFALNEDQQRQFESVVIYVQNFQKLIPISFILGFYVQLVFNRFWQQFNTIPWCFSPALAIVGTIHGDGRARNIRRTCARYINASLIIASSRLHVAAKKRFPTTQHLVHAGILTQREGDLIESTDPVAAQPFLPLIWTTAIVMRAEQDGFIQNPHALVNLISTINSFRGSLLRLFLMDMVCIPLVYTQVVTLAVYLYFVASMIGRQFIIDSSPYSNATRKDYYIPLFTILEFIVYMGWLKVAETLVNPMGEDDEDFDINLIIDANWSYSMTLVDKKHHPTELVKDKFWNSSTVNLPHTEHSKKLQSTHILGSMFNVNVTGADKPTSAVNSHRNSPLPTELVEKSESPVSVTQRRNLSTGSNKIPHLKLFLDSAGANKQDVITPPSEPFTLPQDDDRFPLPAVQEEDEEQDLKGSSPEFPCDPPRSHSVSEVEGNVIHHRQQNVTNADESGAGRVEPLIYSSTPSNINNTIQSIPILKVDSPSTTGTSSSN